MLSEFKNQMEWNDGKEPSIEEIEKLHKEWYFDNQFYYHFGEKQFYAVNNSETPVPEVEAYKYLKGAYAKRNILEREVLNFFPTRDMGIDGVYHKGLFYMFDVLDKFKEELIEKWEKAETFNYFDAFAITNEQFRRLVFQTINISDMMKNLESKRLNTDGIKVKREQYTPEGEFAGYKEYDNIYEVHEINSTNLIKDLLAQDNNGRGREVTNGSEKLYAVKCWCTSTNKEHWLWIEPEYKNDPLTAIASTFRVHKNLIPHIKKLKRQGDILLMELDKEVQPEGEVVPLTKEQYFNLLTCEA
jgi:hypothetical protein